MYATIVYGLSVRCDTVGELKAILELVRTLADSQTRPESARGSRSFSAPPTLLDALMAEKVMGCHLTTHGAVHPHSTVPSLPVCGCPGGPHNDADERNDDCLASYSTDIVAAQTIISRLSPARFEFECGVSYEGAWAMFYDAEDDPSPRPRGEHALRGGAELLPRAICLAALRAVGAEVPA